MSLEDGERVGVALALEYGLAAGGPLEAELEPTDAGEEAGDLEGHI
jgi:hypothetical protein